MEKKTLFKLVISILITVFLFNCSLNDYETNIETDSESEGEVKIYNNSNAHIPNGSSFNFGELAAGLTSNENFTIINNYYKEVELKSYSLSDPDNFTVKGFLPGIKLAKGNSFSFKVQYNPVDNSTNNIQSEYLSICYGDNKVYSINLNGKVIDSEGGIQIYNQNNANIANNGLINFGNVNNGATKIETLTIKNTFVKEMAINSFNLSDNTNFSVKGFVPGIKIKPGETISFSIQFKPSLSINHTYNNETMSICYDGGEIYLLNLSGKGKEPADRIKITLNGNPLANNSGLVNYKSIKCGTKKGIKLRIHNTYYKEIELKSYNLSNIQNFTVKNFISGLKINPGGYIDFNVEFNPIKMFNYSRKYATLSILYDGKTYKLKLKGEAYYEGKVKLRAYGSQGFIYIARDDYIKCRIGIHNEIESTFTLTSHSDNTFSLIAEKNKKYIRVYSDHNTYLRANSTTKGTKETFSLEEKNDLYTLKAHATNRYLGVWNINNNDNLVWANYKKINNSSKFHIIEVD